MWMSVPQMAVALTFTNTSLGPTTGIGSFAIAAPGPEVGLMMALISPVICDAPLLWRSIQHSTGPCSPLAAYTSATQARYVIRHSPLDSLFNPDHERAMMH